MDGYFINTVLKCKYCEVKLVGHYKQVREAFTHHVKTYHGINKKTHNESLKDHWIELDSMPGEFVFECTICKKKLSANSKELLKRKQNKHCKEHKLTYLQYYDMYLKDDSEGLCFTCGKPTKYCRKIHRYRDYCSNVCVLTHPNMVVRAKERIILYNSDPEFVEKRNEGVSIATSERVRNQDDFGLYKIFYKNIKMRSEGEVLFAKKCDHYIITWLYESKTFEVGLSSRRRYTPDFYLPDFGIWIEIKSKKTKLTKGVLKWFESHAYNLMILRPNDFDNFFTLLINRS